MSSDFTKFGTLALTLALLSGCGLFRADFPVRNGPQSAPHVTYATSDQVAQRMVTVGYDAPAPARTICGAGSAEAAQQAAIASGRFGAPVMTNPDARGTRSMLFNDHAGTAVMITTGPGGYDCAWSDRQGALRWRNGAPV